LQPDKLKFSNAFDTVTHQSTISEDQLLKQLEDSGSLSKKHFKFFLSYSYQDVYRRKALYTVAFLAVFISILSLLLIDVFVKKGSLIFVKMSEDLEIDA
jgi:hypothetical protein